jgi:hypothetical protein
VAVGVANERSSHQHVVDAIMGDLAGWDAEAAKRRDRAFNDSQVAIHAKEWLNLLPANAELVEFPMADTVSG